MKQYNRTRLRRHDRKEKFPPKKWRRRRKKAGPPMTLTRRQQHVEDTAARPCPNCGELNVADVDECYGCGYDGYCHNPDCREPTELADTPDLNYCGPDCERQAQLEREVGG